VIVDCDEVGREETGCARRQEEDGQLTITVHAGSIEYLINSVWGPCTARCDSV